MKVDIAGRAVAADHRVLGLLAIIHDMAEQFILWVMGARVTEMVSKAPIGVSRLFFTPFAHRQSAHDDKAATVTNLAPPRRDFWAQRRQGEAVFRDSAQLDAR